MTTASAYFTPGPNGEPAMFGPGGFAEAWTPRKNERSVLRYCEVVGIGGGTFCRAPGIDSDTIHRPESDFVALALCEQAAQKYIRESGYGGEMANDGGLYITSYLNISEDGKHFKPLNGSPDWRRAAEWVAGQR